MLSIKTKKYQLDSKTFLRLSLLDVAREQWWVGLIALAVAAFGLIFPDYWGWFVGAAVLGLVLYVLFWVVQFMGVTQLDQFKIMFERYAYELTPKMIMMRVNTKEGMQFGWENIKRIDRTKEAFVLRVSRAQFIYLPYTIFNSDHDRRAAEALMRRKGLLPSREGAEPTTSTPAKERAPKAAPTKPAAGRKPTARRS
ncbi:MAG: YcxB family protein [Catalinimonas sp.]